MRMRVAPLVLLLCASPSRAIKALEVPEVAVCIAGAARSLATVPVLRGLKRNVLQNPAFTASAFAALSYDTNSPQLMEYNATLAKRLSMPVSVRRALSHLRPELQAVSFYNTSAAQERFRSCQPEDAQHTTTEILALYSMQVCYSLVRQHELARSTQPHGVGVEVFDFVMRIRPDHLFVRPVQLALGLNVSAWPRDRLLTYSGGSPSFAIVPSGPVATVYFRTFAASTSCLFREKGGDEKLPTAFPSTLQCAKLEPWDHLGQCVIRANMLYHGLPLPKTAKRRPALIARICNANETTNRPAWPAWPMPPGETCITTSDMLKRPRVQTARAAGDGVGGAGGMAGVVASSISWNITILMVVCAMSFAIYSFRERLTEDFKAVQDIARFYALPYLEQLGDLVEPYASPAVLSWYRVNILGHELSS